MCGIAGCLSLAAEAGPDEHWVRTATERITHRGPDDEGFYVDPDVALGYKRLAIIDLSPGGHQPMRSADGRYWMVYNGEIYNYVELGEDLRRQGVVLRSSSDSEVLLETYARVGKDVVHRLRGMFAFAIWDTWTRELFCARDPFGIKPFYYRVDRGERPGTAPGRGASTQSRAASQDWPAALGGAPDPGGPFPASGFDQAARPASGGRHAAVGRAPEEAPPTEWHGAEGQSAPRRSGRHAAGGADPARAEAGAPPWGLGGQGSPSWDAFGAGGRDGAPAGGQGGPSWDAFGAGGRDGAPGNGHGQSAPPWEMTGQGGRSEAPWEAAGQGGVPWDAAGQSEALWNAADGVPADVADVAPWDGGGQGRAPWDAARPAGPPWESAERGAWEGAGHDAGPAVAPWDAAGGVANPGAAGPQPWPQQDQGPAGASWEAARPDAAPGAASPSLWQREQPAAPVAAGGHAPGAAAGHGELSLRFCSERKSLAEPGELRQLDPASLRRYLEFQYVPPPETLTPPIKVLPPGHAMIARPGGSVDVYRYWRAELSPAKIGSDSTPRAILAALRDSIAVHLRSDAPLGAFLSGGIDSAAICALAAEHRPDLQTFTVGFEREGYSEIDRAQETAAALGVKSHPYVISPQEFFHYLPQIIWHLDDPMADAAAIPLWFVAREAAKQVKVVLSGEGSDELFGGYAIYHQPGLVRAGERLPEWGRAPLKAAASLIPTGVKGKGLLERTSTPLRRRYIGNAHVFSGGQVDVITRPGPATPYDVTDPLYDQAEDAGLDDVSTMQLVDINTWLAGDILVKADRMTMAHSLELRVPFLDREVMATAARLAREEKIGSGTTKLALRAAMSEVLPRAAAERAKLGFPVPIGHWLKGEAYGFAQHLLREAQTDEWINRDAALSLLERFRSGEPDVTWRHLWVLIVFSLWHQIYVERVYDPVALGWEAPQGVAR